MSKITPRVKKSAAGSYRPPYRFVEAIWDDAASNAETWVNLADIQRPERVITRGWLVKDDPEFVCIASSVAADEEHEENVGNTMTIPRGMIVELVDLVPTRKRPAKAPAAPKPMQAIDDAETQ